MKGFTWKQKKGALAGLAAVLVFCGFFSPFHRAPSLPSNALPVPIVRQSTDYSCGAAALLGVLHFFQLYEEPESSLFASLKTTPKDGTAPDDLFLVAKDLGLEAEMRENTTLAELRTALQQGRPAILDIQAWSGEETEPVWKDTWEEGHYVVAIGMDKTYVYFMDPVVGTGYTYLTQKDLMDRWHDYEDRTGVVRKYYQLAIFLKGKKPLRAFPGPLLATE